MVSFFFFVRFSKEKQMSNVSTYVDSGAVTTFSSRQVLFHSPGTSIQPGTYTVDSFDSGGFDLALPPATGSNHKYVFCSAPRVDGSCPVRIRPSENDTFNTTLGGSYVLDTPNQTLVTVDVAPGLYVLHLQAVPTTSAPRTFTAFKHRVTYVSGSTALLYGGVPAANQIVLDSATYTEQGYMRHIALDFRSVLDCELAVDLGQELVPDGVTVDDVWVQFVDVDTAPPSLPANVRNPTGRRIQLQRVDAVAGVVALRVHVRTLATPALGETLVAHHTQEAPLLSNLYATAGGSHQTTPGSVLQVSNTNFLSGFVPGHSYLITYQQGFPNIGNISLRDAVTDETLPGSSANIFFASDQESIVGFVSFLYVPSTTNSLVFYNDLNPASTDPKYNQLWVQELPYAWGTGKEIHGWPIQGTLNAPVAQSFLSEGVFFTDNSIDSFNICLPPATGSQKSYVITTQQGLPMGRVRNLCVSAGENLNGRTDGIFVLDGVHQGVSLIDVGPQQYAFGWNNLQVYDAPGVADGDWLRFDAGVSMYRPVTLTGKTVWVEDTVRATAATPLGIVETVLATLGSAVSAVEAEDVFDLEGQVTVTVTGDSGGLQLGYRTGGSTIPLTSVDVTSAGTYTLPVSLQTDTAPIEIVAQSSASGTAVVAAHTFFSVLGWRLL